MTKPTVAGRRAATESEWTRTRNQIAQSLPALEQGFFVVLETRDDDPYYVRVLSKGPDGYRAEAVASLFLPEWKQLGEWGDERLTTLGWNPPSDHPETKSANWWREFKPDEPPEIARFAVATLRETFGVTHPHSLVYVASNKSGDVILLPGLGIQHKPAPAPLVDRVGNALQRIFQVETVERDSDGDWPLRIGEGVVYVRAMEREGVVSVFGPALLGLTASPQLLEAVNSVNSKIHGARAWFAGDAVAVASEFVDTAELEGLRPAIETVAALVHVVGQELAATFGGHVAGQAEPPTPPTPPVPSAPTHDPEPGYL